ncbi:hypothetical protein D3C77_259370 [compost metagenome]
MPICEPAPARRKAISTISCSVVAKLLPNATTEEPRRSKSCWFIFVMLANLASAVAASSADMLVATPMLTMVSVKPNIASFLMPNCPAASATLAISVAAWGISFAISRMPCSKTANSSSVASIVFLTPAKAVWKSAAAFMVNPPTAAIGTVNPLVSFPPASDIFSPALLNDSAISPRLFFVLANSVCRVLSRPSVPSSSR